MRDATSLGRRLKVAYIRVASGTNNDELKLAILSSQNLGIDRQTRIDRDDLVAFALQEAEHNFYAKVMDLSTSVRLNIKQDQLVIG